LLTMQNPYWIANRNVFEHNKKRYVLNPTVSYQMFDWLSASVRMRMDNAYSVNTRKLYATTDALFAGGTTTEESKGNYRIGSTNEEQLYLDAILNIHQKFDNYSVQVNVGTSLEDSRATNVGVGGTLKRIPNLFEKENLYQPGVFGSDWREQTQSIFGSAEMAWRGAIYLTLTGRNDWNSTLSGMPQKSFFYPSVGLSGVITELVDLPKVISYLKVRGSFAEVGGGVPRQLSERVYEYNSANPQIYVSISYIPIKEYPGQLYPERTRSWEGGIDLRLFDNTLRLEATYYHTNSFNQTIRVPVSSATGYSSMWVQTGNVRNRGLEFLLGYQKELIKGFVWESTLTASWNENKVIDLGQAIDPSDGTLVVYDSFEMNNVGSMQVRLTEGGTLGDMWSTRTLARDFNGNIWVSSNETINTEDELVKMGTNMPKWRLGFRNDFLWKGISLGVLITARIGGLVLSRTQAMLDDFGVSQAAVNFREAGGKGINNGMINAQEWYRNVGGRQGVYKYYLYNADNVRLQELRIGYYLPSKWFGNKLRMNVAVVANNVWMIYNKAPFDPEATASTGNYYQGVDYFMQPSLRSTGFSIKIDF